MLRGLLLVLLLANLAFFVWSQGGAGSAGEHTAGSEHEPERLSRQWHPEAVELMQAPASAGTASAPAAASSASDAASTAAAGASDAAASAPVAVEASASAASAPASSALAITESVPAGPPGTRCLEAGPFGSNEWSGVERALAAHAKTRSMARRWVQVKPEAAAASAAPQRRLRIDATPDEVAVLEALPASVVGRSFGPCAAH